MKRKYDIDNYEFDKPSGTVHSRVFKQDKLKRKHYALSPAQFDIFNLMMYEVNRSLMKEFKTIKNIINLVKDDYEGFERIIDTQWFELSWKEINSFNKTNKTNRTIVVRLLEDLQNASMETNIIDKHKKLGKTVFSLVRKFTNYKTKIKFKLEPELFQMIMFQQPLTAESFVPLKLKVQSQNLNTVAAKKLYEFLKDWLTMRNDYTISFINLLYLLNIDDTIESNKLYGVFNRNHLKKAVKEINDKTDILISYEPIKERVNDGRLQVTKIKFMMEKQGDAKLRKLGLLDQELDLPLEEQILYNKKKAIALIRLEQSKKFQTITNEEAWLKKTITSITDEFIKNHDLIEQSKLRLDEIDIKIFGELLMQEYGDIVGLKDYRLYFVFDESKPPITNNAKETYDLLKELEEDNTNL